MNPKKPTRLRILEGNKGKRPLSKNESKPPAGKPRCPAHLDAAAKTKWKALAPLLHECGLLTKVDRDALAVYCQLYSRWQKAEKDVSKDGFTIPTTNGNIIQNPALGVANQCLKLMRYFMQEFGMTPASRSRISLPQKPSKTLAETLKD